MAVVAEVLVVDASRQDAERFDELMEESMSVHGGPPSGLMVHIGRPADGGYLLCQVWSTEADMHRYFDEVVMNVLATLGLTMRRTGTWPVWSFART
jgi:hypothetical protein